MFTNNAHYFEFFIIVFLTTEPVKYTILNCVDAWMLSFIAVMLYLLSHTARVLRLIILNPVASYSIKGLWREQYKANGVSILLPFKLGESYRLIYFRTFFGSYFNFDFYLHFLIGRGIFKYIYFINL